MITFIKGPLIEVHPTHVVIEAGGLGYEVFIPLSSFDKLPAPGQVFTLHTHLSIREDAHVLYGFASTAERELFRLLIDKVSGIGPKTALAVLSGMNLTHFKSAVATGDIKSLSRIPGVGKKTAERMVVELKDKMDITATWEAASADRSRDPQEQQVTDAVLALVSLGYKQADAVDILRRLRQKSEYTTASVEILVRAALQSMS